MKKRIKNKLIKAIDAKWSDTNLLVSDSAIQKYGWHSLVKLNGYSKYIEEATPLWTDNWRRIHGYTELEASDKHYKRMIGSATSKAGTTLTLWV